MVSNYKTAVFPGSFDPFTIGHLDVLKSALNLFDKVIIAVGFNHTKKGFMDPVKRVELIKDIIKPLQDAGAALEVTSYTGLTVDLCVRVEADFIVRGLRSTTDFEMESVIAQANGRLQPQITTIFIPASCESSFISSTVVRDVIINGGNASSFMPEGINIEKYI